MSDAPASPAPPKWPHPYRPGEPVSVPHAAARWTSGEPRWHFRIDVAAGSRVADDPATPAPAENEMVSLAVFGRESDDIDVEVLAANAEHEVDPAQWLQWFLAANRITLRSLRSIPTPGGIVGDAVATYSDDTGLRAARMLATKWGNRMFLVWCHCPAGLYAQVAGDFLTSVASFRPLDVTGSLLAEPVVRVEGVVPANWSVAIPASWSIVREEGEAGASEFAATLTAPTGDGAKLTAMILPREHAASGEELAAAYLAELAQNGLAVSNPTTPVAESAGTDATSTLVSATISGGAGTAVVRAVKHPAAWVLLAVLTPSLQQSPPTWMRARRALDIATGTLRLG